MTLPPLSPRYINFFKPFHFTAGDQLVVLIGASHISLPLQEIQSMEWEKKEQTNNMLGLTHVQKGSYVTLCMCKLTLTWVSSEKSSTLLECWLILTRLPSLLWTSSHPTGLSAPVSTGHSRHPSPTSSSSSFVQLSSRVPLPTSGHPRSRVQNPLSGFAPKQTKESSAWRTTYIVLHINYDIITDSHYILCNTNPLWPGIFFTFYTSVFTF